MSNVLTHNELLLRIFERIAREEFGDVEYAGCFSGKFENPIQIILRDRESLMISIINVLHDGSVQ
jgi:hypothetical protein